MKLLPQLLLNLVVVGVALFAYDALRADAPAARDDALAGAVDVTDLENRIARLEAGRTPTLRAEGLDPRLDERLTALEARLGAPRASDGPASGDAAEAGSGGSAPLFSPKGDATPSAPPTGDEISRFLAIQKAALARQRMDQQRQHVATRIAQAGVQLSQGQQEQLVAAYVSFQTRRNAIWSQVKQSARERTPSPDWKTITAETQRRIQREFSEQVAGFLSGAEAEAVAGSLFPTR